MESRMSKHEKQDQNNVVKATRLRKNQYLYDEINDKIGYEEIINLDTQTKIDLVSLTDKKVRRENYQIAKEYKNIILPQKEEEEREVVVEKEKKVYDINNALDEARKNRIKIDELEKKRKLNEKNYNSLKELTQKHIEEKKINKKEINEEELTDLINTITSHSLAEEIEEANKDIFEDLMATNADVKVIDGIAEEAIEEEKKKKIVNSFYTRSMDLSQQDFELSDEIEEENRSRRKKLIIVTVIVLLIGIFIGVFIFLKQKGIL